MSPLAITIVSCSLRADSRSRRLARVVERSVAARGHAPSLIDLRETPPPAFDENDCFAQPRYAELHRAVAGADGVVLCAPVYNWGLGGATRLLIELTGATGEAGLGAAWFDKVVTFVCAGEAVAAELLVRLNRAVAVGLELAGALRQRAYRSKWSL